MIDIDEPAVLLHGDAERIAEKLKVHAKTVKRWKAGTVEIPYAVKLLLRFMQWGELSAIGGKDWEGFRMNGDNTLTVPLFRRPFTAAEIATMFYYNQGRAEDKATIAKLEKMTATISAENEELRRRMFTNETRTPEQPAQMTILPSNNSYASVPLVSANTHWH